MKVLFVGEGEHDLGHADLIGPPRAATGVLPALVRRICPTIVPDSIAIKWSEFSLTALPKSKLTKNLTLDGYYNRVRYAVLLAFLKYNCKGMVCVADHDRSPQFLVEAEQAFASVRNLVGSSFPLVAGLPVRSIEAWTLGAPEAIAEVISKPAADVQAHYKLAQVEEYYGKSGKRDHQPKVILGRICDLAHQHDGTTFRVQVAERTDISRLEKRCPKGFAPFAQRLRQIFGASEA